MTHDLVLAAVTGEQVSFGLGSGLIVALVAAVAVGALGVAVMFRKEVLAAGEGTSAMQTTEKISQGPNTTATLASAGVSSTSAIQDRAPPTIEAALPSPSARPGLPALASG